ncbi:ABC transporter ATP-binding protein [Streptomyces sp. NPDC003077]|uniref:ABC transporter ATP-binding protein n=1 Tax=Streptomyces sp. NPDC003077 TaxID=3154443 RepID=UPI0033A35087
MGGAGVGGARTEDGGASWTSGVRRQWAGGGVAQEVVPALELDAVVRRYRREGGAFHALDGVSVRVAPGRFLAVMGRSGSGKTTFLQCAAGLDRPTSGAVRIAGTELSRLREAELTRLRRERVGFVFQSLNLVPSLNVWENAALPLLLGGARPDDPSVRARALDMLHAVGLADRAADSPARLSGGQRQRVAVARALITDPEVIFADEPTGALDPVTAADVLSLLRGAVDRAGHTVVMVTHDPVAASWADEALFLEAGKVVGHMERPQAASVSEAFARLGER